MKKALFYTFLGIFIATAAVTLLGVTKLISIEKFYLRTLFAALIVELIGAVIVLFRRTDFFTEDEPKHTEVTIGSRRIPGREAGYFRRLLECIDAAKQTEHIKAFIRLTAFSPNELTRKTWFEDFYAKLDERVRTRKVVIEYIFLIPTDAPTGSYKDFISRYEKFAQKIGYVSKLDSRVTAENLHPSIVLLETQQIAFTHDRGDDSTLIVAEEWTAQEDFKRLDHQFDSIELISTPYFRKA